jgi:hypothetical protein
LHTAVFVENDFSDQLRDIEEPTGSYIFENNQLKPETIKKGKEPVRSANSKQVKLGPD